MSIWRFCESNLLQACVSYQTWFTCVMISAYLALSLGIVEWIEHFRCMEIRDVLVIVEDGTKRTRSASVTVQRRHVKCSL